MPMPIPVITQVTPSVSMFAGTRRSISPNAVMKVGEMATPLTNTARVRSGTVSARSSGQAVMARIAKATANCF